MFSVQFSYANTSIRACQKRVRGPSTRLLIRARPAPLLAEQSECKQHASCLVFALAVAKMRPATVYEWTGLAARASPTLRSVISHRCIPHWESRIRFNGIQDLSVCALCRRYFLDFSFPVSGRQDDRAYVCRSHPLIRPFSGQLPG